MELLNQEVQDKRGNCKEREERDGNIDQIVFSLDLLGLTLHLSGGG